LANDALGAWFSCTVAVQGVPDQVSGYVISIGDIDAAVRAELPSVLSPMLWTADGAAANSAATFPSALRVLAQRLSTRLSRPVAGVSLAINPFDSYAWEARMPDSVLITAQIECAAAHRLHAHELDDAKNRALFGKCNNPHGHGHNYRVEVTVAVDPDDPSHMGLVRLASILSDHVERRIDHRHLNLDVPEFAERIPSVENIARACSGWLAAPVSEAGARLVRVTVWETEKTCATVEA